MGRFRNEKRPRSDYGAPAAPSRPLPPLEQCDAAKGGLFFPVDPKAQARRHSKVPALLRIFVAATAEADVLAALKSNPAAMVPGYSGPDMHTVAAYIFNDCSARELCENAKHLLAAAADPSAPMPTVAARSALPEWMAADGAEASMSFAYFEGDELKTRTFAAINVHGPLKATDLVTVSNLRDRRSEQKRCAGTPANAFRMGDALVITPMSKTGGGLDAPVEGAAAEEAAADGDAPKEEAAAERSGSEDGADGGSESDNDEPAEPAEE